MKFVKSHEKPYSPVVDRFEYRQKKSASGDTVIISIELEKVQYVADSSLRVRDFLISSLIAAGNFESFSPTRLADNDTFNSINNADNFEKMAHAAVKLSQEISQ